MSRRSPDAIRDFFATPFNQSPDYIRATQSLQQRQATQSGARFQPWSRTA
ncbi:hypothetical protein DFO61_4146 [Ectopseudomonas oleovorans]|uniref:Uncharacterized protein n=1 Tax=Ectopseudomonas oleovorans TaxID=301 RepID=A0A397MAV4_ECTOL|nr:hypothetical protein DFO61_4146 [Pseudomonas oleovorans]